MGRLAEIDFSPHFHSPEELARKVLQAFCDSQRAIYPIDPFRLLAQLDVVYQFRNFDKLEGIYIVPGDADDIPVVGINCNRPITRQRFTAAHEICHHIKDKKDVYCPIGPREEDPVERYADQFAAALLMPIDELRAVSEKFLKNGYVEFEEVIQIAAYFGVSFDACVYRLAYKLHRISGDTSSKVLKRRIRSFEPQNKKITLGLEKHDLSLLRNIIDSSNLFIQNETAIVWYKFKNDFVYNENRLEGLDIENEKVSEILTDLRLHHKNSQFCNSNFQTVVEVCGHSSLYDYVFETSEKISAFKLLRLNQILYQFSPYAEVAGSYRQVNNLVVQSRFETSDFHDIPAQIYELDKEVQDIVNRKEDLTMTEYIDRVVRVHHRMTVIHPFSDGNGRVTRAFLNWLFKIKGLPPVYIKFKDKQRYFDALSKADLSGSYDSLIEIFCREVLRSMYELNSKFM